MHTFGRPGFYYAIRIIEIVSSMSKTDHHGKNENPIFNVLPPDCDLTIDRENLG